MSGAAEKSKFVFSGRWIPEKSDAGQVFFSFKYWATDDLGLGVDYRPLVDSASFTATYRLISEDPCGWKPAVIVGTSVDDFTDGGDSVESRSYYATVSKAYPQAKFWGITPAPYVGAVWIDKLNELRPLAGINLSHKEASLMLQYSGTDTHLTLSRRLNNHVSVSAIFWGMKYPGLGMRLKF